MRKFSKFSMCVFLLVLLAVLAVKANAQAVPYNVPLNCAPFDDDVKAYKNGHACHGILNFPHFADGSGWDSKFTFAAPADNPVAYYVKWINDAGVSLCMLNIKLGSYDPIMGEGASVAMPAGSTYAVTLTNYASQGQTGSVWVDVWGLSAADLYAQQIQMVYLAVASGSNGGYLTGPTGYPVHKWQIPVLGTWVYPAAASQAKSQWLQPITVSTRAHLSDANAQKVAYSFVNAASIPGDYNPDPQDVVLEVRDTTGVLLTSHTFTNVPLIGSVSGMLDQLFDPATNPGVPDMYPADLSATADTVDLQLVFRSVQGKPLTAMAITINGQAMSSPAPIPMSGTVKGQ